MHVQASPDRPYKLKCAPPLRPIGYQAKNIGVRVRINLTFSALFPRWHRTQKGHLVKSTENVNISKKKYMQWSAVRLRISSRESGLEGVVWPSVRWAAALSWCPVPGGSDLILPAGAWLNTEVRSHQDQRQEAKGEKRREKNIILKCGPWRKTKRQREKYNVAEIITGIEIEEQWSVCGP
jgi:hypothetical protein